MKTLGEVLTLSVKYLEERKIQKPRRQAEELLSKLLQVKRIELYMQFDRPLEEKELVSFREWIARRGKGEPLDYIFQEVLFFNCCFEVNRSCLIPRPETEILLQKVYESLSLNEGAVWDLCSGSGCLGIALKKKLPHLQVTLSDICPDALGVAKKNALKNEVEVNFLLGDLLAPFEGCKADVILCNPPYISEEEYHQLDREVRDFEPKKALVSGITGLECYARLAKELPRYLNPGGKVFFEIGYNQGQKISELFVDDCWKKKNVEKDWAGHDRFFSLEIE